MVPFLFLEAEVAFDLNDLTVGIPSYNTPEVLISSLKSLVDNHPNWDIKLMISENSTNDKTQKILDEMGIPYKKNPGSTHSPSVQKMMDECKTRYFLHLDSDVVITHPLYDLFEKFIKHDLALMGELQENRGGYKLKPRIAPYFCMMDLKKIKESGCLFHDEERIVATGSQGFFANIPIQKNEGQVYYDCGSILFEDCQKKDLKIGNLSVNIHKYVFHAESISWAPNSGVHGYVKLGNYRLAKFNEFASKYNDVDLDEKFLDGWT